MIGSITAIAFSSGLAPAFFVAESRNEPGQIPCEAGFLLAIYTGYTDTLVPFATRGARPLLENYWIPLIECEQDHRI
jgi:hypothetical protein